MFSRHICFYAAFGQFLRESGQFNHRVQEEQSAQRLCWQR